MATLEVLFRPPDGPPIAKRFKRKPLGLFYRTETPIIVSHVMGEADKIGVKAGWHVVRVGGQDLIGLSFEAACKVLWNSAKELTGSGTMRQCPPDTASMANMILWWKPPDHLQAVEVLHRLGYSVLGPKKWQDVTQPRIYLQLASKHAGAASDSDGPHAWYDVLGGLSFNAYTQDRLWVVPRQQTQLRWFLHDPVQLELGRAYDEQFKTEQFAASWWMPSSAVKLGAWLATLAEMINARQLTPALTAAVLCFLEAPQNDEIDWDDARVRGQGYGCCMPATPCASESTQQPDGSSEDAYLVLNDDDMPMSPSTSYSPGGKQGTTGGSLRQIVQFGGHRIVREVI